MQIANISLLSPRRGELLTRMVYFNRARLPLSCVHIAEQAHAAIEAKPPNWLLEGRGEDGVISGRGYLGGGRRAN